jgi:hypothetical protein
LLKASLSAFVGKTVEAPVLAQNFYFCGARSGAPGPGDEEACGDPGKLSVEFVRSAFVSHEFDIGISDALAGRFCPSAGASSERAHVFAEITAWLRASV